MESVQCYVKHSVYWMFRVSGAFSSYYTLSRRCERALNCTEIRLQNNYQPLAVLSMASLNCSTVQSSGWWLRKTTIEFQASTLKTLAAVKACSVSMRPICQSSAVRLQSISRHVISKHSQLTQCKFNHVTKPHVISQLLKFRKAAASNNTYPWQVNNNIFH